MLGCCGNSTRVGVVAADTGVEVGAAVAVPFMLVVAGGAGGWEDGEEQVQGGLDRGARAGVPVLICGEKGTVCTVF